MRKPLINPGIIKRLKSFFAIIQDTDTATRYIPAGKYVLYKNIACHASQNIESGDTLALGTNLVTDSDGFVNCLNDGLKTKVNTSDIVNALTSTDSTKPLSAAQGKVLNDGLTTLNSNKIDKPTSVAAGKFLQTDSNGDAVWGNAASPTDVANAVTDWLDDNIPAGQTVAVDQSLTVSGAAADAKVVGGDISDLKSALRDVYNSEINESVASGNNWFPYKFVAGARYYFINTSETASVGLVAQTLAQPSGYDYIERIGSTTIMPNFPVPFVPQYDASAVYIYATGDGSFKLYSDISLIELYNKTAETNAEIEEIKGTDIPKEIVRNEVIPNYDGLVFSGAKAWNDPLIITIPVFYYRNITAQGAGFWTVSLNANNRTFTLDVNDCLVFDVDTHALSVVSANSVIPQSKIVLLWNYYSQVRGSWAVYYEKFTRTETNVVKYERLMSRQGEGYGYPDNSIEGISAALADGFKMIRISIASTSDGVIYCTHSYEMKNNTSYKNPVLKLDGVDYNQNVNINEVQSTFIDRLTYKGYPIQKLDDALSVASKYNAEITLELKDNFTTAQMQTVLDAIHYYRVKCVISGVLENELEVLTQIDTNLDLAIIMNYSDSYANTLLQTLAGKFKTLRFDSYYTDTISKESVTSIIHPNYTIKLGGSNPTESEIKEDIVWADVCETNIKYSEFIK